MARPDELRELLVVMRALEAGVLRPWQGAAAVQAIWQGSSSPAQWPEPKSADLHDIERSVDDALATTTPRRAFIEAGGLCAPLCSALASRGAHQCKVQPHLRRNGTTGLRELPIDRYTQFAVAGEGGMGIVYVAVDTELNRLVALKMVHPEIGAPRRGDTPRTPWEAQRPQNGHAADFERLSARFLQEAWVTGGLEHPGIAPVHEMGQTPTGIPYYTMRFVAGKRTLADAINEVRAEPIETRLGLIEPLLKVCDTLEYAHAQGVIHRDLKPVNVALGSYGEVILLDWGLARLRDRADTGQELWQQKIHEFREARDVATLTSAVGTPGYMPPEAALGRIDEIGVASDVYSVGAMLFEILTGRLPHDIGEDFADYVVRLVREAAPRARTVEPTVPSALDVVCDACLSIRPDDRPSSVADVAASIRTWQSKRALQSQLDVLLQQADRALDTAQDAIGEQRVTSAGRALTVIAQAENLKADDAAIRTRRRQAELLRARGESERIRQRTRKMKWAAVAATLLVALGAGIWIAVRESRIADEQRAAAAHRAYELGRELMRQGKHMEALDHLLAAREGGLDHAPLNFYLFDAVQRLPVVLPHPTEPRHMALSSNGGLLGTTADDHWVRVFDTTNGSLRHEVTEADGVAILADDSVLTAETSGNVRHWRLGAGEPLRTYIGSGAAMRCCAAARDGSILAGMDSDGTLHVWHEGTAQAVARLPTPPGAVSHLVFSDDASRLLGYRQGWWLWVMKPTPRLLSHVEGTSYAALHPTGDRVLATDGSGIAKVYRAADAKVLHALGERGRMEVGLRQGTCVAWNQSGTVLATGRVEKSCKTWDAQSGTRRASLAHPGFVSFCDFDRDTDRLLTGCFDGTARIWDTATYQLLEALPTGYRGTITWGRFSRDGTSAAYLLPERAQAWVWPTKKARLVWSNHVGTFVAPPERAMLGGRLVGAGPETSLHLTDIGSGQVHASLPTVRGTPVVLPGEHTIAVLSDDEIVLVDPETFSERTRLRGHAEMVRAIGYAPDGMRIATGASDEAVRVWRMPEGALDMELRGHRKGVGYVAWDPDGEHVVTGDGKGTLRRFHVAGGPPRGSVQAHQATVSRMAFDPTGRWLVSGDEDGVVHLLDAASLRIKKRLSPDAVEGQMSVVMDLTFDRRGQRLLVSSTDGTVRGWSVPSGTHLWTLSHGGVATSARFEYDDQIVVSCGWDAVRLWEASTGNLLMVLDHPLAMAAWATDDNLLLTSSYYGKTRAWRIGLETRSTEELRALIKDRVSPISRSRGR